MKLLPGINEIDLLYTSASVNQRQRCIKSFIVKENEYIAFVSFTSVVIAEQREESKGGIHVKSTFQGAPSILSCIEVVLSENLLVFCGSTDGYVNVFALDQQFNVCKSFHLISCMLFPVNSLKCVEIGDKKSYIVNASIDETFINWEFSLIESKTDVEYFEKFIVQGRLCICSTLLKISSQILINLVCLDNGSLEFYLFDYRTKKSKLIHKILAHSDCITCIDVQKHPDYFLLLTGSKDEYIRIYKFYFSVSSPSHQFPAEFSHFSYEQINFSVGLDSVCCNHENWVLGVKFAPQNLSLTTNVWYFISCSMDCSLILWKQDRKTDSSATWLEFKRFGTVGENALGLLDCSFSLTSTFIYAVGLRGNISVWFYNDKDGSWNETYPIVGHFGSISDLSWSRKGRVMEKFSLKKLAAFPYLLSCSLDQTVRLHKKWTSDVGHSSWHEMARPQIHGYDMNCIRSLSLDTYVSGGDEKVLRIFGGLATNTESSQKEITETKVLKGASQPALGLSNFFNDGITTDTLIITENPVDEMRLHRETLWPELRKLYGHSFEIYATDAHPDGSLIASACKSTKQCFAEIILWDSNDWTIKQRLIHHQLTVTNIKFSRDGSHILAVSRDRTWSIHRSENSEFKLVAKSPERTGHTRIIWSCCWFPDDKCFLTGSRDNSIMIWGGFTYDCVQLGVKILEFKDFAEPITALDITFFKTDSYLLAVGRESGLISLMNITIDPESKAKIDGFMTLDSNLCHFSGMVKCLEFCPSNGHDEHLLASGGEDSHIRIFSIK